MNVLQAVGKATRGWNGLGVLAAALLATLTVASGGARAQSADERASLVLHSGIPDGQADVLHTARVALPLTGKSVLSAKILDRATGAVRIVSIDEAGEPVEIQSLQAAEQALLVARNGLLDAPLAERVRAVAAAAAGTDPAQLIPVAIWLAGPDTSVAVDRVRAQGFVLEAGGRPVGDEPEAARAALLAEKSKLYGASNGAFADAVRGLGGRVDYASTHAPLVMASLTVAQVDAVAALPGVRRIHDVPRLASKSLLPPPMFMNSANPAVQNTAMKAAGFTGKPSTKVAIVDSGKPVNFLNPWLAHLNGQSFNVTGLVDGHPTWTAGVIGLKGHPTYKGIAPDVSMLSANYTFLYADGIHENPDGLGDLKCNTPAAGDDVQEIPVGTMGVAPGALLVSTGPDKIVDTAAAGDDKLFYGFVTNMPNFVAAVDWAVTNGASILNFSIGEDVSDLNFDVSDKYLDHLVHEHFVACCVAAGNENKPESIIEPNSGGDLKANTAAAFFADDVQAIAVGAAAAAGAVVVSKGPNGKLETLVLTGDDQFKPLPNTGRVTSPGLAYNVITVGAIDDKDTAALGDDTMASYSNWDTAGLAGIAGLHGDFQKPELSAPGTRILTAAALGNDPDGDGIINAFVHGTSFATPCVSGFLANMIHMDGSLASWPEATKAIALASANRSVSLPALETSGVTGWDDVEGAGSIVIDDGHNLISGKRYRKGTVTAGDFPINRTVYLKQDDSFRYAIAWSTHTSGGTPDNITNDELKADLDIHVYKPGEVITFKAGLSFDNAYEVVSFKAPVTGLYRVEIRAPTFTAASEFLGEAWMARSSFLDLYKPTAGLLGFPVFTGQGLLLAGEPVSVTLTNAKPNALAYMVIGLTVINAPFKGGIMVPIASYTLSLPTNGVGSSIAALVWPAGIPSDFTFILQMWIKDPAGPKGFSASNALRGTTL